MFRTHAMWAKLLSIDSPSRSQPSFWNSSWACAKAMNSVVQTGVKSAG